MRGSPVASWIRGALRIAIYADGPSLPESAPDRMHFLESFPPTAPSLSFVPEEDIQELRALLRTCKQLGHEQTRHT